MRNKIYLSLLILFTAGILLTGCETSNRQVSLTYKFAPDKIYHFRFDSRTSSNMYENDNLVYRGDKSHEILYTQETVEIIDSLKARQRFTYTLNRSTDANPGPKNWSSEFVMAADGRVIGFDMDSAAGDASLAYFRQLMEQAAPVYPDQPISPGYSWNNTVKVLLDEGPADAATTYTLNSLVKEAGYECAVIEYKGTMIIPLEKGAGDDPAAEIDGVDRIDVEGVAYFAYKEGIIVKERENSRLLREGTVVKDGKTIEFKIEEDRKSQTILTDIDQR